MEPPKTLISIQEVAELFAVSVESIRKYKNYRILKVSHRVGNKDLYDREEALIKKGLIKELQVQGLTLAQISEEIEPLYLKEQAAREKRRPGHILIVDDDPTLLDMVRTFLTDEGYKTATCKNGTEALERIASGGLDLVILDLKLPDVDGYEICKKIRRDPDTEHLPIIMLTGYTTVEDKIRGIEGGADDYITKPFNLSELKARIEMVLRRAQR
ncbi:MAG: response regulator [Candidatus Latescibacteria bacterium]|nr:response regulator [Candidatus Latescibacterota bacterium]MCK5327221.1 response regulator [Candidatus Latescibacterota bacterium]